MKTIVCLIISMTWYQASVAQTSIFKKDTVTFVYYGMDEEDTVQSTMVYPEGVEHDTLINHSIYIDEQKNVYWNTMAMAQTEYGLALDLWNLGVRGKDESVRDIVNRIPPAEKSMFPAFRTFKTKDKFYYKTIGNNPNIFFSASLSRSDTLEELPPFMGDGYAQQVSLKNLQMVYAGDTTILLKGLPVLCYRFKSQVNYIADDMQKFSLYYHEVMFEKASLLPVSVVERRCYRTYYRAEQVDVPGYRIVYRTQVITIR